jgi:hypothetical protein
MEEEHPEENGGGGGGGLFTYLREVKLGVKNAFVGREDRHPRLKTFARRGAVGETCHHRRNTVPSHLRDLGV